MIFPGMQSFFVFPTLAAVVPADQGPNVLSTSIPDIYWDLKDDIQVGLQLLWTHCKFDVAQIPFILGPMCSHSIRVSRYQC